MKKQSQTIVKELAIEILNDFELNYDSDVKVSEQHAISLHNVLSVVTDKHVLNVVSKYNRSIARKSRRMIRELLATM